MPVGVVATGAQQWVWDAARTKLPGGRHREATGIAPNEIPIDDGRVVATVQRRLLACLERLFALS